MMRECSRSMAILNAQAIQASAALFGHGDVSSLVIREASVSLIISFDDGWSVYEREIDWLSDRMMCGVSHQLSEDSSSCRFFITLVWDFNPQLR